MSEQNPEQTASIRLPIDWQVPAGVISRYVTHLVVQGTEHEFFLSFFEARPPLIFGPLPDEVTVPAECVARIVLTPERLAEFVGVLQDAVDRHPRTQAQTEES
jgi:hypothetical protein